MSTSTPPESVDMKRIFLQAAALTAVVAVAWSVFGLETPGYDTDSVVPVAANVANTPAEQDVQTMMNQGIAIYVPRIICCWKLIALWE